MKQMLEAVGNHQGQKQHTVVLQGAVHTLKHTLVPDACAKDGRLWQIACGITGSWCAILLMQCGGVIAVRTALFAQLAWVVEAEDLDP